MRGCFIDCRLCTCEVVSLTAGCVHVRLFSLTAGCVHARLFH